MVFGNWNRQDCTHALDARRTPARLESSAVHIPETELSSIIKYNIYEEYDNFSEDWNTYVPDSWNEHSRHRLTTISLPG